MASDWAMENIEVYLWPELYIKQVIRFKGFWEPQSVNLIGIITLVFFQKDNDKKFSFYIENEEELTEQLLSTVKTKRVREDKIKYAINGIFDLIENNLLTTKKVKEMEKNPIIELAELVQKKFGKNIETRVLDKVGADHCPTVFVEIELPDGRTFKASGTNKRIAKQKAAEKALSEFTDI